MDGKERMLVRVFWLLLCLSVFLGGTSKQAEAHSYFTHEPTGSTLINNCPWSALCSGWQDFYNTMAIPGGGIQTGNGPLSPPNSFKYFMAPGANQGGTQLDLSFTPTKHIFIGATVKTNADFVGYANGNNKIFLVRNQETPSVVELFTSLSGVGVSPPQWVSGRVGYNNQNVGVLNNCHLDSVVGDCPGGVNMYPNRGSVPWTRGVDHKLELELKSSSTNSNQDGIVRIWLDGTLILEHTNAVTGQSGWSSISITPTWDGQGAASCWNGTTNPFGRDCTKQWEWWIDHFYVSDATGASPTPPSPTPPPPTPTPPPPTPTPTPPPPPPSGAPGTVSDLSATAVNSTRASVQFTAVSDGSGNPAKYDIRAHRDVMSWGSAQPISRGTCTVPFTPGVMNQVVSCNIDGLTAGYTYKLQLVGFRGTMNLDAVYGSLSNIASVTMLGDTPPPTPPPPTPPPTPPSPPPGISAPTNLTLRSADTYRVVNKGNIWELRGAATPYVLYKNGSCGTCDVVGYSLVFSTDLDTIGVEFVPGKYQYLDVELNEWVVISGPIVGLTGASVTGSFSYAGTIPAGFNVYWSPTPGGEKVRLPLYTGVWDRGFYDTQHSFGCYEVRGYDGTGIEGPATPEVCTASGPGSSRDIGQITPRKVIDFAGAVWELQGVSAPYVMYKDGVCECTLAGYSLRYKTGVVEMEYLPGKWVRRDATLNEWVITAP